MSEGLEVPGDALVWRRIPPDFYQHEQEYLTSQAFCPSPQDVNGLSVGLKSSYSDCHDFLRCTKATVGEEYMVVEIPVGRFLEEGLSVVRAPLPDDVGHCLVPGLTPENNKSKASKNRRRRLALPLPVIHGPFRHQA